MAAMHSWVHKLLITAAVPKRVAFYALVKHRTGWDEAQIRHYQNQRLRQLMAYCWQHVPFYRAHWRGAIAGPQDVQTVADLPRLPLLSKDHVRDHLDTLTTTHPGIRSTPARTGGSTGRPIIFRMTDSDEQLAWAQMYTGWSWAGYRLGEPFLAVGGESIGVALGDKRNLRDWVMNRWVSSGSNLTLERTQALTQTRHFQRIRLIYGYPNSIRELCEFLALLKTRPPALRAVVCTAEVMRPEVRARIAEVLGVSAVHDQYGLNDGGLFACEGPERDGLHLFFHRGILEVLDAHGRPIQALHESGRAVATLFSNPAMPLVRYETGDQVHWHSREPAASGVRWPRIGPVDGRTGDVLYLPNGRSVPMPGLTLVMRWMDGLNSYQFIQVQANAVTVRLARGPGFVLTQSQVLAYLQEKIASNVHWHVVWGEPERTANGKVLIIRNDWLRGQGLSRPPASTDGAVA